MPCCSAGIVAGRWVARGLEAALVGHRHHQDRQDPHAVAIIGRRFEPAMKSVRRKSYSAGVHVGWSTSSRPAFRRRIDKLAVECLENHLQERGGFARELAQGNAIGPWGFLRVSTCIARPAVGAPETRCCPSRAGWRRGALFHGSSSSIDCSRQRPPRATTDQPLRADREDIPYDQHPDHQLRIDRRAPHGRIMRSKFAAKPRQIERSVDLPHQMIFGNRIAEMNS